MKHFIFLIPFFAFTMVFCESQQSNIDEFQERIVEYLEGQDGDFAFVFIDLSGQNRQLMINPDTVFHAASTMKTPVMIEVFRQAEMGRFSLDDSLMVKNEFKSIVDGSAYSIEIPEENDDPVFDHIGEPMQIRDIIHAMITVSSNPGTNMLIELVTADSVRATMEKMDAPNMNVLRGLYDMEAFNLGMNNTTTARDLAVIFRSLAEREVISGEAGDEMIDILKDQYYRDVFPANVPPEVEFAHKTGSISGVEHDSGIAYLPDGRSYVLVYLSKNLPDDERGREIGAELSRMVYEFMIQN